MSQNFKLKFDEMQEGNPADASGNDTWENDLYDTPGHVRNLCFVWPDGRSMFLNYAYLVTGELHHDKQTIKLSYTTHLVTLKGTELTKLFNLINLHQIKSIICIEERYKTVVDKIDWVVHQIEIAS